MNIPNALTLMRILFIPVLVVVFYLPQANSHIWATGLFIVAAFTDWLDGYLARKLDQSTPFGAFLDPVADKIMVAVALVLLVEHFASIWFSLPALVIIGREIVISALREWMAELGQRASVAVSYIGKVKTMAQMGAITAFLFLAGEEMPNFEMFAYLVLYIAAGLTLWSMLIYLKAAWPLLVSQAKD